MLPPADPVISIAGGGHLQVEEDYFDSKFKVEQGNQNTFAISDGQTHLLVDPKFHDSQFGPSFIFFEIFNKDFLMRPEDITKEAFGAIVLSDNCDIPTLE